MTVIDRIALFQPSWPVEFRRPIGFYHLDKQDFQCQDAVIRLLEIIGEAAGRLSDETRSKHEHLPWGVVLDENADARALSRFSVVLLPNASILSDREVDLRFLLEVFICHTCSYVLAPDPTVNLSNAPETSVALSNEVYPPCLL